LRSAVEREVFYDRADCDAAAHELADGVAHVLIDTSGAIDPANHQDVTSPKLVKEPSALKYRVERSEATSYREKKGRFEAV
jgi:hypothetical protein